MFCAKIFYKKNDLFSAIRQALAVFLLISGLFLRFGPVFGDENVEKTVRVRLRAEAVSAEPPENLAHHEPNGTLEKASEITGRLVADYRTANQSGFLAIERADGEIAAFRQTEVDELIELETPFVPLTKKELGEKLLAEAGADFKTESCDHFLIVYNTSEAYARWCGKLFEALYGSFERYQQRHGFDLPEPEFTMTVILFSNRCQFVDYARRDIPNPEGIAAYYNRLTNRVVLYDLSEEETGRSGLSRKHLLTVEQIDEFLSRPQAAFNVATIIHEATHQIAFNRQMFRRTGPYPLWLAEGLSMFFETPDENSARGWSSRGNANKPNLMRLDHLQKYLATGAPDPFRDVIREDRFNENLIDSYAASWGLFFYVNAKEPKKLAEYVKIISNKPPYAVYSSQDRLEDFEKTFGADWDKFHRALLRFLGRVR